jgi:hypothetical protein
VVLLALKVAAKTGEAERAGLARLGDLELFARFVSLVGEMEAVSKEAAAHVGAKGLPSGSPCLAEAGRVSSELGEAALELARRAKPGDSSEAVVGIAWIRMASDRVSCFEELSGRPLPGALRTFDRSVALFGERTSVSRVWKRAAEYFEHRLESLNRFGDRGEILGVVKEMSEKSERRVAEKGCFELGIDGCWRSSEVREEAARALKVV